MGNSWASSRAAAGIVQMGNIDRFSKDHWRQVS
jgi:hypothetical protein